MQIVDKALASWGGMGKREECEDSAETIKSMMESMITIDQLL